MINRKLIIFIIAISPILLIAEYSWQRSEYEYMVQEGIGQLYNYQFDAAISSFEQVRLFDNSHPVPIFVLISARWLKSQVEDGYDASYEIINLEVENAIPIYKKLLLDHQNDPELLLYLGSTYGMRARTALASKEWFDVLYNGYQGLKYIQKAKEIDSDLKDIYMPIGIMDYFACLSSSPVKWGAKLVGVSADCKQGLENLRIAANESHYSWIEASNVLTYAYLHIERDFVNAEKYINPLVDKFPGHPFFAFLKGEVLVKMGKWNELDNLMPALEKFSSNGPSLQQDECKLKLEYLKALKALNNGNYDLSIQKCNWIINNYNMEFDWLKGFTYLLRGKNYDLLKKRKLALKDYKIVIKMDQYYPEVAEAKDYIKNPFTL